MIKPLWSEDKSQSEFIDLVMKDASPEEREETTRRWFGFLSILERVVRQQEEKGKGVLVGYCPDPEAHGKNLVSRR